MSIKLVVGLCNPGSVYEKTRHNAGEWFIRQYAEKNQLPFKVDKKFHGEISAHKEVHLLIPKTFMNCSGQAVAAMAHFYKLTPEEILVVHDELDLPPGIVKLKSHGGHGGHNGLRDIINKLNSNQFHRLRIGIGHPGHRDLVHNYVLGKPSNIEKIAMLNAVDRAIDVLPLVLDGQLEKAMQQLHT